MFQVRDRIRTRWGLRVGCSTYRVRRKPQKSRSRAFASVCGLLPDFQRRDSCETVVRSPLRQDGAEGPGPVYRRGYDGYGYGQGQVAGRHVPFMGVRLLAIPKHHLCLQEGEAPPSSSVPQNLDDGLQEVEDTLEEDEEEEEEEEDDFAEDPTLDLQDHRHREEHRLLQERLKQAQQELKLQQQQEPDVRKDSTSHSEALPECLGCGYSLTTLLHRRGCANCTASIATGTSLCIMLPVHRPPGLFDSGLGVQLGRGG